MRSDEEDDEDEYYDENDNDNEEDEEDGGNSGIDRGDDGDDGEGDDGSADGSEDDGSEDDNGDGDGDEEADEADGDVDADVDDEDEDEDEEVDVDAEDDEAEGDEDDNDNDNDDADEDDHEQEGSTEDDEGDSKEEIDGEDGDVDVTMDGEGADVEAASSHPSQSSKLRSIRETNLPPPPYMIRRSLFTPAFTSPPKSLSIEAIVGIPLPSPVHSLAATSCLSYLLAGSQDGYVRAYDLWASVNGGQMMTAQQRSVVGLGETVSKAGVGRGWWANEVDGIAAGGIQKRSEPVYSMAAESDGLWALTGTQSGPINLYTMRHAPGHLVHSLKGHTNVVSCMALLPSEKGFLSGSWDGTVREWDLNTGQTVRTYPTHGAQLSSISLRPFSHPPSPSPSPSPRKREREDGDEDDAEERRDDRAPKENISISMGSDFFGNKKDVDKEDEQAAEATIPVEDDQPKSDPAEAVQADGNGGPVVKSEESNGDIEMSEVKSPAGSMDSLFGDGDDEDGNADAEGETVPPSLVPTNAPTPLRDVSPAPLSSKAKPFGLALPGQPKPLAPPTAAAPPTPSKPTAPSSVVEQPTPSSSSAPFFTPHASIAGPSHSRQAASHIPLLSPTSYKAFSDDVILTSSMDGQVVLIDRRVPSHEGTGVGVGRLQPGERAPPWCMSASWLSNGNQVLAGRRNGTIDIWDLRRSSSSTAPNLLRTLRTPAESGLVSCVVAFPDGQHVATASQDNVRLWNTAEYFDPEESMRKKSSKPPFKIIAGHHGGTVSSMIVDPTGRFLITASGDRGWQGETTKVVLIHEVKW
ncbi:hypothetical protein IAU59_006962 [Kwoniella sp. CBS 9459]